MAKNREERKPENRTFPPRVMTLREVGQFLHVHPSTIYRLIKENELMAFKLGRDWRFNIEQVDQLRFSQESLAAQIKAKRPVASQLTKPGRGRRITPQEVNARQETEARTRPNDSTQLNSEEAQFKGSELTVNIADVSRSYEGNNARSGDLQSRQGVSEASLLRHIHQLEEENRHLKGIVADQALDIRALRHTLAKRGSDPR